MRFNLPISAHLVRTLALSLGFAACVLWGIERTAEHMLIQLTGDPFAPSSKGVGHPHLLWEMPPGDVDVQGQRIQVNSMGARGPELEKNPASGTRRVISVGGDTAFGRGVQRTETYSVDAINSLGGNRVGVETILLAVPEYTIDQTRNLMDMRGWPLSPNLLIVAGPAHEMDVAPYVDKDVIARFKSPIELSKSLKETAVFRILDYWLRIQSGPTAQRRQSAFIQGKNINPQQKPRVGTNAYAQHLDKLVEEALQNQTDVVFVMLPVPADLMASHMDDRVLLYRDALNHVAVRHGVPTVDGPKLFVDSGRKHAELFAENATLTKRGHRILSYALAQKLRPWLRGRKLNKKGTGATIPTLKEPSLIGDEI